MHGRSKIFEEEQRHGHARIAKKMYEKVVEDNKDAIATAKSVKQLEMLNAVREGYEKQLESANEGNYDSVVTSLIPGITEGLNESGDFDGLIPIVRQGNFESSQGDKILEVRVITAASLAGNKYKTIKVDDYRNYYKELAFKNLKTPGGAEIDFDDVRTFMDVEADELKSYVEYEKSYLEMEMEKTFREDFATYSKTEMSDRIGKELNEAAGKYIAGEAMEDAPMHRKSIVPGAPDLTTVMRVAATIGASCLGGPLAGLLVQGAFTLLDKHDGYIASWRQAGVQFGIAAATTLATMGAGGGGWSATQQLGMQTGINIATSGIKYNSDGSIGWSNDQFKAGIKSGAVNFALGYAGQNMDFLKNNAWARSGATSFTNSTLDFNEGGFKIGIRDDNNWGDRFVGAAASASAAYATEKLTNMAKVSGETESTRDSQSNGANRKTYTGGITTQEYASHLISNTINAGVMSVYNMARYDMSWSDASTTTGFYSGMNYSVSDLGGFTGSLAMGAAGHFYQKKKNNEAVEDAEKEGRTATDADGNPLTKDPLGGVENFLAGMYESICGSFSRLKEGAGGLFESVKNWSDDKGFMTDAEVTTKLDELKLRKAELETKTQLAYLNNAGDKNVMSDGSPEQSAELAAMKAADDLNNIEKEISKLESSDKGIFSTIGGAIVNFPESIKNKFLCGVYGLNGEADVLDAKLEKVRNQVREMTSERAKGNIYYEALKNDKVFSVRLYEAITSGTTLEGEANMMMNALLKFTPELVKDMQDMNAEHGRAGQGCSPIQREDYESESKYKEAQKQFVKDILKDYTKAYLKEHKDAALSWIKRDAALNGMSDSTAIFGGVAFLAYVGLGGNVKVNTDKVQANAKVDIMEKTGELNANIDTPYVDVKINAVKKEKNPYDSKAKEEEIYAQVDGEVSVMLNNGNEIYVDGHYLKFNSNTVRKDVGVGYRTTVDSTNIDVGASFEVVKDRKDEEKETKKTKQIKIRAGIDIKY